VIRRSTRQNTHEKPSTTRLRLLYLSERLCQHVSAELGKTRNPAAAFRLVKPLVRRAALMLKTVMLERHMPPALRVISEVPNLDARVPFWLAAVAVQLAGKIDEWASHHVAKYLSNNVEEFRRISSTHRDGVTLRVTMTRIPGMAMLRLVAQHKQPTGTGGITWLKGTPDFAVVAHPGYAIK
jgi:hypothetical protein